MQCSSTVRQLYKVFFANNKLLQKLSALELTGRAFYCVYYALIVSSLTLHSFSPIWKEQWLDETEEDQVNKLITILTF